MVYLQKNGNGKNVRFKSTHYRKENVKFQAHFSQKRIIPLERLQKSIYKYT